MNEFVFVTVGYFEPECFTVKSKTGRRRLTPTAVPTILSQQHSTTIYRTAARFPTAKTEELQRWCSLKKTTRYSTLIRWEQVVRANEATVNTPGITSAITEWCIQSEVESAPIPTHHPLVDRLIKKFIYVRPHITFKKLSDCKE